MGKVYKVELPVIGKIVALKLLAPHPLFIDLMGADKARELFITEALNMSALRHPNIVDILDFDESKTHVFYTMDYLSNNLGTIIGETYEVETPSRVIQLDRAIHYIQQTLEGLDCLHYHGIIHRDIKPFNLLLTEQDTVKICDFGLSKLRNECLWVPEGLKIGSAFYAAPEQEDDPEQADVPADLYAVGVMMYRMFTGMLPARPSIPPSHYNTDLDENWDQFVLKAIAPQPDQRFSSAKTMQTALDLLYENWQLEQEKSCRLTDTLPKSSLMGHDESGAKTTDPLRRLRSQPVKIHPGQAQQFFGTDGLWRPRRYHQNHFIKQDNGTVMDIATGLAWEMSGSPYPMSWQKTRAYINSLNHHQYGGCTNWRLPTIDELMSLLTQPPHGEDFCLEPFFDQHQKWLWSCDRRSFTAAWYVNVDMGFVAWQDFSGYYFVKAVSSKPQKKYLRK
jgi:serine/threonine-protein kinase